jgi:hypothetical protein
MIKYTGSNGTSLNKAIKIVGARNEWKWVDAEYHLIGLIFDIIKKGLDALAAGIIFSW